MTAAPRLWWIAFAWGFGAGLAVARVLVAMGGPW